MLVGGNDHGESGALAGLEPLVAASEIEPHQQIAPRLVVMETGLNEIIL